MSGVIGGLPPQPPTLRGRIGMLLTKLVRRATAWQTTELTQFHQASIVLAAAQMEALAALAAGNATLVREVHQLRDVISHLLHDVNVTISSQATLRRMGEQLEATSRQHAADTSILLQELVSLKRRIEQQEEGRPTSQRLGQFYLAFEERFRGSRTDIKNRLAMYLATIRELGIGSSDMPIIDVGCGRGEWLELLREAGLVGTGVDVSHPMTSFCRSLGFTVAEADGLTYLSKIGTGSIGAVTAFHVIEHQSFPYVMALTEQLFRVLKQKGLVIIETPNPANLLVASERFYLDPTHLRPVPSPLMRMLLEEHGFEVLNCITLHPPPESHSVGPSPWGDTLLSDLLYGGQDYAIIAMKR